MKSKIEKTHEIQKADIQQQKVDLNFKYRRK